MSETWTAIGRGIWLLFAYGVLVLLGLGVNLLEQLAADHA